MWRRMDWWEGHHVLRCRSPFHRPIKVSDVVEVTARVVHTGPRSVHISVHVTTIDTGEGQVQSVAHGLVVVVSLDERGNARPVPAWKPLSGEDHRLDQHARHLIELRQFIEPSTMAAELPATPTGATTSDAIAV